MGRKRGQRFYLYKIQKNEDMRVAFAGVGVKHKNLMFEDNL
jgi:hypothetical protein